MSGTIVCIDRGNEAVDNLGRKLNPDTVQFVLIKVPIGSGTFQRNKYIYVHYIGAKCSPSKKLKINSLKDDVLRLFRTSYGVEAGSESDVTFEAVVSKFRKIFVADDGSSCSLAQLKEDYRKNIQKTELLRKKEKAEKGTSEKVGISSSAQQVPSSPVRTGRKLATEFGMEVDKVLKAVRDDDFGPFNWCVFEPRADIKKPLQLIQAGSNGIFELIEHLSDKNVTFGLIRIALGEGRFRRTKRVFFQWTGEDVGVVSRGKFNSCYDAMHSSLGPSNASIKLQGKDERNLEFILLKCNSAFVVDNIHAPKLEIAGKREVKDEENTREEYVKALREEQDKVSEFYNEPPTTTESESEPVQVNAPPKIFNAEETVQRIYDSDESRCLSYGIFEVAF